MRLGASRFMQRILYSHNDCVIPAVGIQPFRAIIPSHLPGRPRLLVNLDQVESLRSSGYTWDEVSQALEVNRSTLWRRMKVECIPK